MAPSSPSLVAAALLLGGAMAGCPFGGDDAATVGAKCPFSGIEAKVLSKAGWTPTSEPSTVQGCTCTTSCGTSAGSLDCDWCKTSDDCGHYELVGFYHWDYCTYPEASVADWEAQSAQAKEDALWDLVTAAPSSLEYPNIAGIFVEDIQKSFDTNWDWMNEGRVKYIHGVGAVCKVDFDVTAAGYTGVFEQGTSRGLIRMGSALDQFSSTSSNPVPGNGFKFLRSNVPSANWVSLHALEAPASGSFNFFGVNQSNHIPPPASIPSKVLLPKFEEASGCAQQVGLSDAASYTQAGARVDAPAFPSRLTFVPTADAASYFQEGVTPIEAYMANFEAIPAGTTLYTVFAEASPGAALAPFGTIATTSECTRSDFGDHNLFFRHQRIEEDWALRPEWMAAVDAEYECSSSSISITPPVKCIDED